MNFHSRTISTRDDWQTPIEIIKSLGQFDLDPCANDDAPTRCAKAGYTYCGLDWDWEGRVWLNPPYGADAKNWLARLAAHGDGIALIPPRMGSHWFHEIVLANADAMLFLKGRIAFINPVDGTPVNGNNADSVLIAFGKNNVLALRNCGLSGRLWVIK